MAGFLSQSMDGSRTPDPEVSHTEWHATSFTVSQLAPAAEPEGDLSDFNIGDGPIAYSAADAGQAERQ